MRDIRPNIIFIMSDDHAAHAMSCYESRINTTPHIDRIARGGLRADNCFCTNGICSPSRAAILTGTYNHVNNVTTLETPLDNTLTMFPGLLGDAGYQTALFGKWHLGQGPNHCPAGFDDWAVLPGQGNYHNPDFIFKGPGGGAKRTVKGYVTDLITDMSLNWMDQRDKNRPFCLLVHHKAPHREWEPDAAHAHLYENETIPEPPTLYDHYENRSRAAAIAHMRVGEHMQAKDLKCAIPPELKGDALRKWAYQLYIKEYLRVIASMDDNIGRLLDYLDDHGLTENTIVAYTSDQGFFLGDHGWYDKRFMYEESLRMPFVMRFPREIPAGSTTRDFLLNVDFAPTFLDYAGVAIPPDMQGRSARSMLRGDTPDDWQTEMYYRYWMNQSDHNVAAHYGIRTHRYKLIYYYADGCGQPGSDGSLCAGYDAPEVLASELEPEWELFDLAKDHQELKNVYHDPSYQSVVRELTARLADIQEKVGDRPFQSSRIP